MHDDPIVYAAKDKISYYVMAFILLVYIFASIETIPFLGDLLRTTPELGISRWKCQPTDMVEVQGSAAQGFTPYDRGESGWAGGNCSPSC